MVSVFWLALLLTFFPAPGHAQSDRPVHKQLASATFVKLRHQPNYDTEIIAPLHQEQTNRLADCNRDGGTLTGQTCVLPPPPPPPPPPPTPPPPTPAVEVQVAAAPSSDGLVGQVGWSSGAGNCVLEPGVNNPGYGNPIDWPVLYSVPHIGSTVLFTWNHTAVVVGLWSDGSVEVGQENAPGMTHRIPPSWIRGYR